MKITDPDLLAQTTDVVFDTANRTIEVKSTGAISAQDGVTLQCLYSFCKEEWNGDATLIKYPFPMEAITPEQFEFKNGWAPKNQTTINLFRDGGFAIKNAAGTSAAEYIGCITLGSIGASDQVYYQQENGGTAANVVLTGPVNQSICVMSAKTTADAGLQTTMTYITGDFDYRSYFKIFVREYQKQYAQSQISDIGVSTFTYQAYRFPLANSADLKITHDDTAVQAGVYNTMTITYYGANQSRNIGGSSYNFNVIIDGKNATAEQIYERVQYELRLATDIDDGAGNVIGKTANSLLRFVGDTLVTSNGVYIDNFKSTDTNRLEFYDVGGVKRTFPYVAAGTITFNDNLVNDGNAIYKMYYTSGFGTAGATLVLNNADSPIQGTISGSSVTFDYDYDGDTQGGGAGIDKNVTVVAIGKTKAQYVIATGTIYRSTANSISLSAALERNYSAG